MTSTGEMRGVISEERLWVCACMCVCACVYSLPPDLGLSKGEKTSLQFIPIAFWEKASDPLSGLFLSTEGLHYLPELITVQAAEEIQHAALHFTPVPTTSSEISRFASQVKT